jgi:hypothetical protein
MLSYGLLNTVYYLGAFLFVWYILQTVLSAMSLNGFLN